MLSISVITLAILLMIDKKLFGPQQVSIALAYLAEATSCDRLDENAIAFLEGGNSSQSISYEIPKGGPLQKNEIIHDVFAELHAMKAEFTSLHITDEAENGGMWVNGLKRIGHKKMNMIDYTFYKGRGEVRDLYWQQRELPVVFQGEKLSVFGEVIEV